MYEQAKRKLLAALPSRVQYTIQEHRDADEREYSDCVLVDGDRTVEARNCASLTQAVDKALAQLAEATEKF